MASSPFERQLAEADAKKEDRSSMTSGMSDAPQQFEPSPSFLDFDRPNIRLVELPAWLQSFASSLGEPSESEIPSVLDEEIPLEQPVNTPKESGEIDAQADSTSRPSSSSGMGSDFISEDDLPEWLRSIAPEEGGDSSPAVFSFDRGGTSDEIPVPNVSRAWSTSKDARGPDEATTLFALVASQTPQTALPVGEPERPGVPGNGSSSSSDGVNSVASFGSGTPPDKSAPIDLSDTTERDEATTVSKTRRSLVPVIVAALMLLGLIGVAAVLFF